MSLIEKNLDVTMLLENLEPVPHFALPETISFRWYQKGDAVNWIEIQAAADIYNQISLELFEREFNRDEAALAERMCFLLDSSGHVFGTAAAWFDNNYRGRPYGRVHWVAIMPSMQGRGLAKPLMSIICRRLAELGHRRAYLTTSSARIPAISLYLKFGFQPETRGENDRLVWDEIYRDVALKKSG